MSYFQTSRDVGRDGQEVTYNDGMGHMRAPFSRMEWSLAAPLESKKTCADPRVSMLQFDPGFSDPNWCVNAHVGLVLSGSIELEFEDSGEVYGEGDAFVIHGGTRHRARNSGPSPVRLFIVTNP